ncbi:MAG: hypothetical protein R3F34_19885 [Planctomycetota bacterium]
MGRARGGRAGGLDLKLPTARAQIVVRLDGDALATSRIGAPTGC